MTSQTLIMQIQMLNVGMVLSVLLAHFTMHSCQKCLTASNSEKQSVDNDCGDLCKSIGLNF